MTVVIEGGRLSGDPRPPGRTRNTGTAADLLAAGIDPIWEGATTGILAGWVFSFENYYWVAQASAGIVLPIKYATPLHESNGKEVRVDGNCTCPSPERWFNPSRGFAGVPLYHVDSIEGLKALADAIRKWRFDVAPEAGLSVHDWQHARARRSRPPQWTHDCNRCEYMGPSMVWDLIVQGQKRRVEWYSCRSGRDVESLPQDANGRIERDDKGNLVTLNDCRGKPAELLRTSIIGRYGNEGHEYWSMDCKSIAEWYEPGSVNSGPSDIVDAAQDKLIEFEIWPVKTRRPGGGS